MNDKTLVKFQRDNNKSWVVVDSRIGETTIQKGKNAGKPNPKAGEVIWNDTNAKYPGNVNAMARWLLDYALREYTGPFDDIESLKHTIEQFQVAVEQAEANIVAQLKKVNGETHVAI